MSTFLALALGWYMLIFGILILIRQDYLRTAMADILSSHGLFLLTGVITFLLGLLMVLSHNIWVRNWPVLVTVLSWLTLISGLIRLFFPETALSAWRSILHHPNGLNITGIVTLIIGLFLLYYGYYGVSDIIGFKL